jgi:SAM-dependent methyltransferase
MGVPLLGQDIPYETLKQNLLELTAAVAPHYDDYESHFFASRAYREFENYVMDAEIAKIYQSGRYTFADLGCATGSTLYRVANEFSQELYGFDISGAMIDCANRKLENLSPVMRERILFQEYDLERGIPLKAGSVSFVSLNFGTASDIRNIDKLLLEIQRVLRRAGRFLLSFYNRNALLYNWSSFPWPTSMAAEMNHDQRCLTVHCNDRVFPVYARAYNVEQIRGLMPSLLKVSDILTYPAISSILPENALQDMQAQRAIIQLDRRLSKPTDGVYLGAYLVVTGERSNFD